MLSTPVWGVDIKNDVEAPLLAPCFLKNAVTGITPQEQRGNGIPKTAAVNIEEYDFPPKYFEINSTVSKIDKTPEIKNPRIKKGDISLNKAYILFKYV